MPRTARIAPRGHIFHILTRGNNRLNVFRDEIDYQKYLEILHRYRKKYQFKVYHYVLMRESCSSGPGATGSRWKLG